MKSSTPAEIVISPPSSVGIVFENVIPTPAKADPAKLSTTAEINNAENLFFIPIYPSFIKFFVSFYCSPLFSCFTNLSAVTVACDAPAAVEVVVAYLQDDDRYSEEAYAYSEVLACYPAEVSSLHPDEAHMVSEEAVCCHPAEVASVYARPMEVASVACVHPAAMASVYAHPAEVASAATVLVFFQEHQVQR